MMKRTRAAMIVLGLASTACLIEPNPDFIDPTADETGTGNADDTDDTDDTGPSVCPVGTLDCDDEPGCESDADDPSSCGSCSKICEFDGEQLECVAGECTGTVVFTELADVHVDSDQPSQNFGFAPSLIVDKSRTSYIALPDISELPSTTTLAHVGLHVTCIEPGSTVEMQRVESEWDEQQLTQSSAPSGSEVIGNVDFTLGENVIELTGMLPSWRSGTPKRSLELSSIGPDPVLVELSSREGASPPYLVLTLSW
jgi:hypothetical protein